MKDDIQKVGTGRQGCVKGHTAGGWEWHFDCTRGESARGRRLRGTCIVTPVTQQTHSVQGAHTNPFPIPQLKCGLCVVMGQ